MKHLIKYLVLSLFLVCSVSCDSKDSIPGAKNIIFKAYLNGGNATPANNSAGLGIATLTFDPNTNGFSMTIQYSGLSPISATIYNHLGATSEEQIGSFSGLTSETINYGSLNPAQKEDLLTNNFTLNLNSSDFPDGEICGHLIKQNNDDIPPPPPAKM